LHGGTIPWLDFPFSFNLADTAISLGVVLLLLESIIARDEKEEKRHHAEIRE
jgi:lipoprotein signal peptidase